MSVYSILPDYPYGFELSWIIVNCCNVHYVGLHQLNVFIILLVHYGDSIQVNILIKKKHNLSVTA